MKETRPKTIFCDIDGTLVAHESPFKATKPNFEMQILPGTIEKLEEWDRAGHNIILTTGRRESMRKVTEDQLSKAGIIYDYLLMGIKGGKRYLINDRKPYGSEDYALAINIDRNEGIKNINL
tara:strand:- start:376 stop:741 length:366 start_codon:yes stop_codon:yes gene_type:complete